NVYELRIGGETRSTLTQDQVEYVLRSELLCELAGGGGVQSRDAVLLHRGAHPLRVQRDVRGHPTDLPSKQRRDPLSVSLRNTTLRRRIGNHDLVAVPDILTGGAGGRRPRRAGGCADRQRRAQYGARNKTSHYPFLRS